MLLILVTVFSIYLLEISSADERDLNNVIAKAEKGNVNAQYALAVLYTTGKLGSTTVAVDSTLAAYWARQAASNGNADSAGLLAARYYEGSGVPKDLGQAQKYALLAMKISDGHPIGSYVFGLILEGEKSYSSAIMFFSKAADNGNIEAGYKAAKMTIDHQSDIILPKTISYLVAAAKAGHAKAQFELGSLLRESSKTRPTAFYFDEYFKGRKVISSYKKLHANEAYAWLFCASKQSVFKAKAQLFWMSESKEAQILAENYYRKYVAPFK